MRYLQNPDCVRRSRSLSPSCDNNHIVSNRDEVALLAEINGILNPGIHIIHPGSSWPLLLIVQGDAASEDLSLPGHLGEPGDGEDGAVGLVLADQVRGGATGGEDHDSRGFTLVGGEDSRDSSGGGVVTGRHVLQIGKLSVIISERRNIRI